MKIELTQEQQKMLVSLIENTSFAGRDAEIIVQLKKALQTNLMLTENVKISEEALKKFNKK